MTDPKHDATSPAAGAERQYTQGPEPVARTDATPAVGQQLIPLSAVPKLEIMPRPRGRCLHASTVFRWASRGIGGVVLRTWQVGRARCTTVADLMMFFASLTPKPNAIPRANATDAAEAVERAQRELRRMLARDATPARRRRKGGNS